MVARYAFHVGLSHSLLHAGSSRRVSGRHSTSLRIGTVAAAGCHASIPSITRGVLPLLPGILTRSPSCRGSNRVTPHTGRTEGMET
jgi:hypothetical protein